MSSLTRRASLGLTGAALAMPFISTRAAAADFTWQLGHIAPLTTPLHQKLLEAAEAVTKRSEGRIELKIFGAGALGVQAGLLDQVRRGAGAQMTVVTNTQLMASVADCGLITAGYMFNDAAAAWRGTDTEIAPYLRPRIGAALGVEVFEKAWDFGFRTITNAVRPINTPADLAGLKLRVQIESGQMDMFKALDAVPISLSLEYLKNALRHHLAEGQESLLALTQYAGLSDVQSHCAMTRHGWDCLWLCVNAEAWKQLPERFRQIVTNAFNGAAVKQRDASAELETTLREVLTKNGMAFTDPDPAPFRELLKKHGYYEAFKKRLGTENWKVIQKASGLTV